MESPTLRKTSSNSWNGAAAVDAAEATQPELPDLTIQSGGTTAPCTASALGSGVGALAVAADMARWGRRTVLAGLDDDRAGLDPVAAAGTVALSIDAHDEIQVPVAVAGSIPEALAGAKLVVVATPCRARGRAHPGDRRAAGQPPNRPQQRLASSRPAICLA